MKQKEAKKLLDRILMEYIDVEFGRLAELVDTNPFLERVLEPKPGERNTVELTFTWYVKSANRRFVCVQGRLYFGVGGQKKKAATRCFMREERESDYSRSPQSILPCGLIMDQFPFITQSSWTEADKRTSGTRKRRDRFE